MSLSPTSVSPSVLVVGAGPVGSVLALTLLKNGIPVRIIDKAGPQIGQKGAGIQPRSLEMHYFLGTLPDFLDVGKVLPPCTVYKLPGGTEILKTFEMIPYEEARPDIPYINAVMLGQHRQQSILHRHLEKYGSLRSQGEEIASEFSAYAKSLVETVLILPALSQSEQIASGQQFGVDLVLRDGGGHTYKGYPALPGSCTVVVVRPDGIIGAIVGGVDGLRQYLSGVFLASK
ncbi:hypothetical protein EV359DRAFT_65254 [Lentinula novae-zelandiae]|nr:hypothetical protein EV359DRAFT_65254 [Lentinula novae-zelandiae]